MENTTETIERYKEIIARQQTLIEVLQRLRANDYYPWQNAAGPSECLHGRAKGIACPLCDRNTELDAMRPHLPVDHSGDALELQGAKDAYRNAWIRARVEAWVARSMEKLGDLKADPINEDGSTTPLEAADIPWQIAARLYAKGREYGFLP
jgi:hypothetical protein